MAADRFPTGKTTDGLVDNGLENGSCEVFLGGPFVDEGLDIGLGKYATARSNGVEGFVALGIFV